MMVSDDSHQDYYLLSASRRELLMVMCRYRGYRAAAASSGTNDVESVEGS